MQVDVQEDTDHQQGAAALVACIPSEAQQV